MRDWRGVGFATSGHGDALVSQWSLVEGQAMPGLLQRKAAHPVHSAVIC